MTTAARRSVAARVAAGCGWRRSAARASTPSEPARPSPLSATTVATACPFCLVMLRDGVADAGARGEGVQVQDISEILAAGLPVSGGNGRSLPVVQ